MQHLETCLLIAEADRVLCHLVLFLNVFFHWIYKIKYGCYQDSSVRWPKLKCCRKRKILPANYKCCCKLKIVQAK